MLGCQRVYSAPRERTFLISSRVMRPSRRGRAGLVAAGGGAVCSAFLWFPVRKTGRAPGRSSPGQSRRTRGCRAVCCGRSAVQPPRLCGPTRPVFGIPHRRRPQRGPVGPLPDPFRGVGSAPLLPTPAKLRAPRAPPGPDRPQSAAVTTATHGAGRGALRRPVVPPRCAPARSRFPFRSGNNAHGKEKPHPEERARENSSAAQCV